MATNLTNTERTAITQAIRAGTPRNQIARDHQRSPGTITRIAQAEGLAFDRSATKIATEAAEADAALERARLAARMVAEGHAQMDLLHKPCVERKALVVSDGAQIGSHVEIVDVQLDQPSFADRQRIFTMAAISVDKSIAVARHDQAKDDAGAVSLLEQLIGGLADIAA
jgi:hypothetical protein